MAIIGNLYKLEKLLKDKNLNIVFEYIKNSLDKENDIHKRIINIKEKSCEKIILSDEIFALEQVSYTQSRDETFIESHKKYIDFQMVVMGNEQMEYIDIDKLTVDSKYDETKDLITYKLHDDTSKFVLQGGDLAIFFPDDGHLGLASYKKSELIHKVVVKLPIHLW